LTASKKPLLGSLYKTGVNNKRKLMIKLTAFETSLDKEFSIENINPRPNVNNSRGMITKGAKIEAIEGTIL